MGANCILYINKFLQMSLYLDFGGKFCRQYLIFQLLGSFGQNKKYIPMPPLVCLSCGLSVCLVYTLYLHIMEFLTEAMMTALFYAGLGLYTILMTDNEGWQLCALWSRWCCLTFCKYLCQHRICGYGSIWQHSANNGESVLFTLTLTFPTLRFPRLTEDWRLLLKLDETLKSLLYLKISL